nr:hypothetical protein [Angustibacter aerolatus]
MTGIGSPNGEAFISALLGYSRRPQDGRTPPRCSWLRGGVLSHVRGRAVVRW